jgi:hypothetical protein
VKNCRYFSLFTAIKSWLKKGKKTFSNGLFIHSAKMCLRRVDEHAIRKHCGFSGRKGMKNDDVPWWIDGEIAG